MISGRERIGNSIQVTEFSAIIKHRKEKNDTQLQCVSLFFFINFVREDIFLSFGNAVTKTTAAPAVIIVALPRVLTLFSVFSLAFASHSLQSAPWSSVKMQRHFLHIKESFSPHFKQNRSSFLYFFFFWFATQASFVHALIFGIIFSLSSVISDHL